jgi:tetratricopeptide (TPR) repeat protein
VPVEPAYLIAAVVGALALFVVLVWLGARSSRWLAAWRVTRARQRRRSALEAARSRDPRSRYGLSYEPADEETVLMSEKTRARLSQKHIDTLLHRARAATAAGDFRQAVACYSELLDGSPDQVDARVERGRAYLDLGDYNRAMSDFVVAEDLVPDSPLPLVAIGDLHFARKDYARAIECFDLALSIAPDHAMAWCRRGLSHAYRGHHDLACRDLLQAKKLDADIPNLDTHLAMARRKGTSRRAR